MTKSQIPFSGGGGGLLTYFPIFVPEFKNDKIPVSYV